MVEKEALEMLKVRPKESDNRDDILSLAFGVGHLIWWEGGGGLYTSNGAFRRITRF